jgi:hypothetical protein
VRPRVGRVGPLRPNWPSSSLYCHNHAFDALRRPSRPSCAASECHCAPLHGRQYMSVYDLARIWSISPLYRVVLTRGLLLAGPPYVFLPSFGVRTPIPEFCHRYTPTSAKEQLYRLSQQGTSRLRFQHLLTLRTTNSRRSHPLCRWESPPATSVQFGVPDNWQSWAHLGLRCFS